MPMSQTTSQKPSSPKMESNHIWEFVFQKPENFDEQLDKVENPICKNCTSAHALICMIGDRALEAINLLCTPRTSNYSNPAALANRLNTSSVQLDPLDGCGLDQLRSKV